MAAWAGGYQGCLERVWLYQAYLIDSLNDYDDQTIGWQCKGKNWDRDAKKCKEEWTRMVRRICIHILPDQADLFNTQKTSQEAEQVRSYPTTSLYTVWVMRKTVRDGQ
jgi:hypothetical protein